MTLMYWILKSIFDIDTITISYDDIWAKNIIIIKILLERTFTVLSTESLRFDDIYCSFSITITYFDADFYEISITFVCLIESDEFV